MGSEMCIRDSVSAERSTRSSRSTPCGASDPGLLGVERSVPPCSGSPVGNPAPRHGRTAAAQRLWWQRTQRLSRGMAQALALLPAPLKRTEFVVDCAPGRRERIVLQLEAHGVPSRMRAIASAVLLTSSWPS